MARSDLRRKLQIVPCSLEEANSFVRKHHRHHDPVPGHKFSIAVSDGDKIVGVAIIGRPVSRHLDDGMRLEVNRVCTDETPNACSALYSAAWRAARAMGYRELWTYTNENESGASLRGAGWKCLGNATSRPGQGWDVPSRPRVDTHPLQQKIRWMVSNGA